MAISAWHRRRGQFDGNSELGVMGAEANRCLGVFLQSVMEVVVVKPGDRGKL